ncbi:MAG: nicotinic acid mononucleotide adenylyltransferase, partial [Bacteroidetes bacterium]|nr:nicotinic acid mononucleotide adenylyltransferase [Bacteroidota bacterium]
KVDEVWWILSPQNPHKSPEILAPFKDRWNMLCDALDKPYFIPSDFESHLPTPSYTIDTLEALKESFPDHHWKILMGQDSWNNLPTWKNGESIETHFDIWVYPRPYESQFRQGKFTPLDLTPWDISSTDIRNRLAQSSTKLDIPEILPCTFDYITTRKLYQAK